MLDREEYIEQAHFFRAVGERLEENTPLQDLLFQIQQELLATTRMPMAVDYLRSELTHRGRMASAMQRLSHYFTPFQAYIVTEAEDDRGRFDMRIAVQVLLREAEYRAESPSPQGAFLYCFETLCRNHLRYTPGLDALAGDPMFNADWREWIKIVSRQAGLVDFADLLFVRSEHYVARKRRIDPDYQAERPVLFGDREGKIALANRRKDPRYLFSALQRQLGYPEAPRPERPDESRELVPNLLRRVELLETRLRMLEEEQRQGVVDLTKLYPPPS